MLERPSQPVNFSATTEDDTSLKLSWSKPVNTNGEIDYYIVSTFIRVATTYFCYDAQCYQPLACM